MRNAAFALAFALLLTGSCKSDSGARSGSEPRTSRETQPRPSRTAPSGETTPPRQEPTGDALEKAWEELTLAEQKRAYLVEQHVARAVELRDELRLDEAQEELARALDLQPDNLAASELMAEIGALQGRSVDQTRTISSELERQYELRVQQLREEARENLRKAKVHLARGDYDAAIVELELATDMVRFAPYSIEWQGIDGEIDDLLKSARTQRETAQTAARDEARRKAREDLRQREVAEEERRNAVVGNLLKQAIAAFRTQEYDEAIRFAERVLRLEPRNSRALELRDNAFRAGRDKVRQDFLQRKREQYKRWQEEIDEMRIPYVEVVNLPDEDYWREITKQRAQRQGFEIQTAAASEVELAQSLQSKTIPGLKYTDEESLTTVVDGLRAITGMPLVVHPLAEEAVIDEGVVFEFDFTNPLTVEEALNLVCDMAGEEVTWTIRHDAVLITTKEKARGELQILNHDVQDLIFGLTDFLGPRINRLRLIDDLEDQEGGGLFGGIGGRPVLNDPDDLLTLVQDNVAQGTWDEEGISLNIEGGNMIVVHTAEVQKQVRQFLEDLRRFSASLVTIESKFLTVADNYIQEIGVDFRGLDNPGLPFTDLDDFTNLLEDNSSLGLDNSGTGLAAGSPSAGAFFDDGQDGDFKGRTENFFGSPLGDALTTIGGLTAQWTFLNDLQFSAILTLIEKNENIELINDQVLSLQNTQRGYVTVVNQQAYVQDFDVEVAQFEAIADPVINVLTEGIVLDVRPTIHHNRRYLTLEVQPTVARVVALNDFTTTLSGQTQAVTLTLPELEVQSVFTTAVVPDGGSILVGGLSRVRNVERRAEVPWIANVPLIGFFFKEEGYSDERESLMILIRAWITDVRNELAKLER